MYIVDLIKRNKIALFLLFLIFCFVFGFWGRSTCNGVTGYGLCYTKDNKTIHLSPLNYSPLNYIFPTPPPPTTAVTFGLTRRRL